MWLSEGWEGKKESLFGNRDAAGSVKMRFGERRSCDLGSSKSRMLSRNGRGVPTTESDPPESHPAWRETAHKEEIYQINKGADVWHKGEDLLVDHRRSKSGDTDSPANPVRTHLRTFTAPPPPNRTDLITLYRGRLNTEALEEQRKLSHAFLGLSVLSFFPTCKHPSTWIYLQDFPVLCTNLTGKPTRNKHKKRLS